MLLALATSALSLAAVSYAQGDLSAANNVTYLEGTWSSNPAVSTGGSFCVPAEMKFTYPENTGIAYSFTNDGFFEEAQYRYTSNGSNPSCIQATIFWQHGTYGLNDNGSITLYPFGPDGRIQVQDPCAAVTNIITYYNQQTLYSDWGITIEEQSRNYVLKLNRFDGAKMPYMFLTARPPNMLPTQLLTGTNASGQVVQTRKRSVSPISLFKRSSAAPRSFLSRDTVAAGAIGVALGGVAWLGIGLL
ncbi:chaperone for protein-folding within the ER, fungal-domain-containing protein [Papiliotrema laurentii]|uniref:Protein ROT1 n=1 Tax=Papiliotrema laurentii TaxID=5418 RepID=A0AAD9FJY2_PAPLA|nr:chaperone for protein-folding within the ER, fungal-domain-containing protein [Papiliotrema laurentii]